MPWGNNDNANTPDNFGTAKAMVVLHTEQTLMVTL